MAKTTKPKGLNPPGTTRPVRGKPDVIAAVDTPIEVPVYVSYERHFSDKPKTGKSRGSGRPLTDMPKHEQLLGWTTVIEAFTYGEEIRVKIGHESHVLEVWAGGKCVYKSTKRTTAGSQIPPCTYPRFDPKYKENASAGTLHDHPNCPHAAVDDDPILDDDDDFEEE